MRVGLVTNIVPHFQVRFFEELARRHDLEVLLVGGNEDYRDRRNSIALGNFRGEYLSGYDLIPKFRILPTLAPRILRGRFDVLITSSDGRFALPCSWGVSRFGRIPFVLWTGFWYHPDTFFHRLSRPLLRGIYQRAEAVMVYGDHVKRYLVSQGTDPDKVFCAWHTADNSLFARPVAEAEKREIRKELGLPEGKVVLYVGRLDPVKGLDILLEAVAGLGRPDVHLLLVGDGPVAPSLREQAKRLGFGNLHITGYCTNTLLYRYYGIADVFVLASVSLPHVKEAWGIVVNEAMNQGKPIVTTDAVGAGVGGLVQNDDNGFVVPERNVSALRQAVGRILFEEGLAERMGNRSRSIIAGWTFERMADGADAAIEHAFAAGPRVRRAQGPREVPLGPGATAGLRQR